MVVAAAYPVAANAGLAGHLDSVDNHLGREARGRPVAVSSVKKQTGYVGDDIEGAPEQAVSGRLEELGGGRSVLYIGSEREKRLNELNRPFLFCSVRA